MATVQLGNANALEPGTGRPIPDNQITTIRVPDSDTRDQQMSNIVHQDGHWTQHSSSPPAWVESDDPELADLLSRHLGCPIGRPDGWEA